MKIYLAGCGKIGQRLGHVLCKKHDVVGLKRNVEQLDFPVETIDLSESITLDTLKNDADVIVFTITPSQYSEAGYKTVYDTILGNVIEWVNQHTTPPLFLLVSSTGVYGQNNSEWVDETSATEPMSVTAKWIIYGENQLRTRVSNTLTVRFSGIYGNGRDRLIRKALSLSESGEPIQQSPPVWTNRIHESDCVGSLAFLIEQYALGKSLDKIYLITDHAPVSQYDVLTHICQQLRCPAPPVKTSDLTENFNKRCDNSRITSLGYRFIYPSYTNGYSNMESKK